MKGHTEKGVVHSFRHSLRDRLREAGVDREIIDQLGGWSVSNVGESYGAGHSLQTIWGAKTLIGHHFYQDFL